jgi:O-antigen/teichoic acid export membrane protein
MFRPLAALSQKVSPDLRKIMGNAAWLFSDRIFRMGLSVLVGAWVARYLGTGDFGAYNYGLAFVSLFGAFATLGLEQIVIRDIVKLPMERYDILGTALLLRIGGGLLTLVAAAIGIMGVRPGQEGTHWLVIVLAISLVFQAFDVIDFWFRSQVQSKYAIWAKNLAFVVSNLIKVGLIQMKASVIWFAWIYTAEFAFAAIAMVAIYQFTGPSLLAWRWRWDWAKRLLGDSWTLILSSFVINIYMRIDQIMLGQMVSDEAVGIYSVAVRVSELWYFVPMAVSTSVYPSIVAAKELGEAVYYGRLQKILDLMAVMSYGAALFFSVASGLIIQVLFGAEYQGAAAILVVHVWAGVFVSLGVIRSLWTTTEGLMQFAFITTAIGALINVGLNFLLIPRYGGVGAAIATVVSQAFAGYVTGAFFSETRRIFALQTRALLTPNILRLLKSS